jgi:hypothetical protein
MEMIQEIWIRRKLPRNIIVVPLALHCGSKEDEIKLSLQ